MKHPGSVMEYAFERMLDLMRAYDEYIGSCNFVEVDDVYRNIVNMPSKRFWVSGVRASIVVSALLRGEDVMNKMHPSKREMYTEIYRRVLVLRVDRPQNSVLELCEVVIDSPAPKFYMSPARARVLVSKVRKTWNKMKLDNLRRHVR